MQLKTLVYFLMPNTVPLSQLREYENGLLTPFRLNEDAPTEKWRYDYLVGAFEPAFGDGKSDAQLPLDLRERYAGCICSAEAAPVEKTPGALVTPDGIWHDLEDFGWKMIGDEHNNKLARAKWIERFRSLLAENTNCWLIAVWAHS